MDTFLEVGFFEQEVAVSKKSALQYFWDQYPGYTNGEVRAALAKCGLTSVHVETPMCALSGGEQAKVRLGILMHTPYNILVLDEPTNHLDVDALEELHKAIKKYKGTVVLVSHDPNFYEDLVDDIWDLEAWTTKLL